MRYIVKSVVCDYGVYQKKDDKEKLIDICNSKSNAELIADILNTDLKNERYEVVKKSKVDKAIEEIKEQSYLSYDDNPRSVLDEECVLEILKRNIGE